MPGVSPAQGTNAVWIIRFVFSFVKEGCFCFKMKPNGRHNFCVQNFSRILIKIPGSADQPKNQANLLP